MPPKRLLGYILKKRFDTLDDSCFKQEYKDRYQEMMEVNRVSIERIGELEEEKLVQIGKDKTDLMERGALPRRRGARLRMLAGRRRAQPQALRRDKLNSQSLRNHLQHMRQAVPEAQGSSADY